MKEFAKYFSGLKRDYGFCNVGNGYIDAESGKLKFDPGDYGWSKKPITEKNYEDHLAGKRAIGIQPCDDNGMVSFGAIDVDPKNYRNFPLQQYLKVIEEKELPIIPIESKSKGLHLYVFTKEKIPATLIREFLSNLLFLFKLPPKTEIFPKQTHLGTNQNNVKTSGSFINLPYYKSTERRAYRPDGSQLDLKEFIEVVKLNLQTKETLEDTGIKKINETIKGGPTEFEDGPPCLQMICKEIKEKDEKLKDERDRFLYNYMVFSKKKYKDVWEKKVLEAARDFIVYDDEWGDNKVKTKIKEWKNANKGFLCNEVPLSSNCVKGICLKRKFGVAGYKETSWPELSGMIRINYKPKPEFMINVALDNGKVEQLHARDVKKITEMKELRNLIGEQTNIMPPLLKGPEFQSILNGLWSNFEEIPPPVGTSPIDILKEEIIRFVNGPKAKTDVSWASGAVLEDKDYYYFNYEYLYDRIRTRDWTKDRSRTATMIKQYFKGDFNCIKRFPKGESKTSHEPRRCLKLPRKDLEKEEIPDEKIKIEDKENIV